MGITNTQSGTNVHEIADGIYRINTPVPPAAIPGGFSFNQYLVVDEAPLLFHTGGRRLFPLVKEAIESVIPIGKLRWISFSHVESDESGSINELLAVAPNAEPLCGQIGAMVSMNDLADRAPRALADDERVSLGKRTLRWIYTPHLPHAWECGYLFEETTKTLLCGDLFTQPGPGEKPLTESDILGPSQAMRQAMNYWSCSPDSKTLLHRLGALEPTTLACMHGSAWRGDGKKLLGALADTFRTERT